LRFQDRGSLDPTTNKGNSTELPLPSSSCCLSLHALLPITQPVAPQPPNGRGTEQGHNSAGAQAHSGPRLSDVLQSGGEDWRQPVMSSVSETIGPPSDLPAEPPMTNELERCLAAADRGCPVRFVVLWPGRSGSRATCGLLRFSSVDRLSSVPVPGFWQSAGERPMKSSMLTGEATLWMGCFGAMAQLCCPLTRDG